MVEGVLVEGVRGYVEEEKEAVTTQASENETAGPASSSQVMGCAIFWQAYC